MPYVALSIISMIECALSGSNFYTAHAATFEVPWISLTTGLNFLLTTLITIRLLLHRRSMFATSKFAAMYTTDIIAILVESAAPFTAAGIVFAVLLGKNHPGQSAASLVCGTFVVRISPLLIFSASSTFIFRAFHRSLLSFALQWGVRGQGMNLPLDQS
jgi:hypothetical protein